MLMVGIALAIIIGGVGFYVSDNIKAEMVKELSVITEDVEAIFIEIYVPEQKNFVIGEIYRPPNSSHSQFIEILQNILSVPYLADKRMILMGDYNLNLLHLNDNAVIFQP